MVYFISGANKGIGLSLAKQISARENVLVLATARNPDAATELNSLPNVKVLKLDVTSKKSTIEVAKAVSKVAGKIDVLISNAGIAKNFKSLLETTEESYLDHYRTNFLGSVFLVQALHPFLEQGESKKIFFISSTVGSISGQIGGQALSVSAYGQFKAALNYISKELSLELGPSGFIVIAAHPGIVSTDINRGILGLLKGVDNQAYEMVQSSTISPDASANGLLKLFDKSTAKNNGKFLSYDGIELQW